MTHCNRMIPYMLGAAGVAVVLSVLGVPLASLLPYTLFLACPLMMVSMMRGHGGADREDHVGHGCEHDPTRRAEHHDDHAVR